VALIANDENEVLFQSARSNKELQHEKQAQMDRLEELSKLKAIVQKAMTNPTPENVKAAKAAAMQMQSASKPPTMQIESVNKPPTQEVAKPEAKKPEATTDAAPASGKLDNKMLAKKKQADMDRLKELKRLKAVVHKAMTNPTPKNVQAAQAAAMQLSKLAHKQTTPTAPANTPQQAKAPQPAAPQPAVATTTAQPQAQQKKTKIHGASPADLKKLKNLVKKAMTAKTPQEKMSYLQAVQALQAKMQTEKKYKSPKVPVPVAPEAAPKGAAPQNEAAAPQKTATAPEAPKEQNDVLFEIAIDGMGKISVHAGDRASTLAKEFATNHHLSDQMAAKLEQMVAQQMDLHHVSQGEEQKKPVEQHAVTQKKSVVPQSNHQLKKQKKAAMEKVEELKRLGAVVHKAMTNPTAANVKAAKAAAQQLAQLQAKK
jgi:hypothetical protein